MKLKTIAIFVFFAFAFGFAHVAAQQKIIEGQSLDKISAVVGAEIILKSDVDGQLAIYLQQDAAARADEVSARKRILDMLIDEKLVLTRAVEDSIEATDEEVQQAWEAQLARLVERFGSVARIEAIYGMTIGKIQNDFREDIRKMLLTEKIRQKQFGEIAVSLREVQEFYAQYKDSMQSIPAKLELYHLVKNVTAGKNAKDRVYELADKIRDSIVKGGDFADFAKRYSADPGSAPNGGDLGWFEKGKLFKEFEQAAFNLQIGQISRPVETPFGFHIIQTLNKNKDSVYTRHILLRTGRNTEEVDTTKAILADLKRRAMSGESFEELAKKYSDEKETQGFGGLIGKYSVDNIPANLSEIFNKIDVGGISDPILFTSEPTQSYHIIYKKRLIPEHRPDLTEDYKDIEKMAMLFKQNKLYKEWIAELRASIYWEIKE